MATPRDPLVRAPVDSLPSVTAAPIENDLPPDADVHTTAGKLAELRRRREEALHPGNEAALEKRHAQGKRGARERL